MPTYTFRWTVPAEIDTTVEADDEDAAYDTALTLATEVTYQVSVPTNNTSIAVSIDGVGGDLVEG